MSPQLLSRSENRRRPSSDEASDPTDVLSALNDTDCRRVLKATADQALTVQELSEACDLPLSTAYRKVDLLTDAGLLTESIRLRASGKHPTEYRRSFDDVVVHLLEEGDVEIDLTREPTSERPDEASAAVSATW